MQIYLRQYATSSTVDFPLYSTDGTTFLVSAAFISGCSVLSIDGGVSAITTNIPAVRNNGFSVNFTSSEMTGKRVIVKIVDIAASKTWLDTSFVIETYGTSGSEHPNMGNLPPTVDGLTLTEIFEDIIALSEGKISKSGDVYTYYKQDNSTVAFILSAGTTGRIKLG